MKFLRTIEGKTRNDRVRNADIRKELKQRSMREEIKNKEIKLVRACKRMRGQRLPKIMEELKLDGKRPRRHSYTWRKKGARPHVERRSVRSRNRIHILKVVREKQQKLLGS